MTRFGIALALTVLIAACGSDPKSPQSQPSTTPPSATDTSAAPIAPSAQATTAPNASDGKTQTAHAGEPALPSLGLRDLQQVVREPVRSIGVDTQKGRVAALVYAASGGIARTWMDDGSGWKSMPIPDALKAAAGERDDARIFFGRDNLPRIMGARSAADGPRQLYLRYRHGAWKQWPKEMASFAGKPHAALYGVLGWDDPEVLCKVGAFCLIKQRRGWSEVVLPVASPAKAIRVDLGADGAYALLARKLLKLGKSSWLPMGGDGSWNSPPAAAWIAGKQAWVSEPGSDSIHHLSEGGWRRQRAPVRAPHGLWSPAPGELWVVGADGAAYFDGERWSRIAGLAGPLRDVIGHGERIWLAGPAGVWQARRPHR